MDEEAVQRIVTERINLFHDALVKRGQIGPLVPQKVIEENAPQSLQGGSSASIKSDSTISRV